MKTAQEIHIETLEKELNDLRGGLAEKEAVITEQDKAIVKQHETIIQKNHQIDDLRFQVAQFQRMLFGAKRERFISKEHPGQLSLSFDIPDQKIEEEIARDKQQISYERKKNTRSKPHPGREALPSHLPVVETVLEPQEDVSDKVLIGQDITDELEYTPATLFINRTIRPKYISKEATDGTQKQIIAQLNRPIPKCIAGPELLSHMAVEKYVFHMPIYRQLQRFKQNDVHIKSSTSDSWMRLLAEHIQPLYAVHKSYTLSTGYLQVDESPIRVLDRDKPGATHHGYMWVYRAPMQNAVFFDYNKGRGSAVPRENLSDFKGYLQTDGYAVYNTYDNQQNVTHINCWAHARRYFEQALKNDNMRAGRIMELIQDLYAIEQKAKQQALSAEKRYELRLEESLPILNEIGKYIADQTKNVLPKSPIGKAFAYCTSRWDNLLNYLKDGNIEIDNNNIENAIRPLALGRKNYLFAGSHDAAQNIAMYYSFFATCKIHDIHPQKWLTYVIRNIADTKTSRLKNLLPQFFDKKILL